MRTLLLDTCALLHLEAQAIVTADVIDAIQAARSRRRLFVSTMTAVEIARKATRTGPARLAIDRPAARWYADAVAKYGLKELPLTSRVAFAMYDDLGPTFHPDPVDRAIVSAARLGRHRLVTCDGRIIAQAASSNACDVLAYDKRPGTP